MPLPSPLKGITKMKFRVLQSTLEYSELKIIGLKLEKRMSLEINFQSYSVCFPEGLGEV